MVYFLFFFLIHKNVERNWENLHVSSERVRMFQITLTHLSHLTYCQQIWLVFLFTLYCMFLVFINVWTMRETSSSTLESFFGEATEQTCHGITKQWMNVTGIRNFKVIRGEKCWRNVLEMCFYFSSLALKRIMSRTGMCFGSLGSEDERKQRLFFNIPGMFCTEVRAQKLSQIIYLWWLCVRACVCMCMRMCAMQVYVHKPMHMIQNHMTVQIILEVYKMYCTCHSPFPADANVVMHDVPPAVQTQEDWWWVGAQC